MLGSKEIQSNMPVVKPLPTTGGISFAPAPVQTTKPKTVQPISQPLYTVQSSFQAPKPVQTKNDAPIAFSNDNEVDDCIKQMIVDKIKLFNSALQTKISSYADMSSKVSNLLYFLFI